MAKNPKSKNSNKENPEDVLKRIKPKQQVKDRLQLWYPNTNLLWFACGDGKETVFINCRKKLMISDKALKSKLTPNIVKYYQEDKAIIPAAHIIKGLLSILQNYIYFNDPRLYYLVSIWIIGTYFYTMFGHYGYLFFYSNLKRSGKTRTQEIISHLAFEASNPQNAPTPPVIRELATEGGTIQLDTLERWREKNQESFSAAMDILDAGFRNGGQVSKMVLQGKKWIKEFFPVFSPYVLTGIYKDSLSDTALDRSFVIEAKRKSAGLKKKRYNYSKCEKECSPVRGCLYVWALQNAKQVYRIYQSKELAIELNQIHLNDRAEDIWLPILTLARAIGIGKNSKEWKELISLAKEMGSDPEYTEDARRLAIILALRKQIDTNGNVIGITSELLNHVQRGGISLKPKELTTFLNLWGFEQKKIRFPNGPRRAWELEDKKLAEIEKQLRVTVSPDE